MQNYQRLSKIILGCIIGLNAFAIFQAFRYKSFVALVLAMIGVLLLTFCFRLYKKLQDLDTNASEEDLL